MARLPSCPSCGGLVPARVLTCPHCDASVVTAPTTLQKLARGLLAATSGGALSVTLMACYGSAPVDCEPETVCDDEGNCEEVEVESCDPVCDVTFENVCDDEGANCEDVEIENCDDAGVTDDDAGVTDDDAGTADAG